MTTATAQAAPDTEFIKYRLAKLGRTKGKVRLGQIQGRGKLGQICVTINDHASFLQ